MVRDLQMTPSLIEMRVRINGNQGCIGRVGTRYLGPLRAVAHFPDDEQARLAEQRMGPWERR